MIDHKIAVTLLFTFLVASCASQKKSENQASSSTGKAFDLLQSHSKLSDKPLAGSYEAGAEIFKSSDGGAEAEIAFKNNGPYLVLFCGVRCSPEGEDGIPVDQIGSLIKDKAYRHIFVPGSTDVWSAQRAPYFKAALKYVGKFNKRMVELQRAKKNQ